ncbi:hypothetical protein LTR37_009224 [Vermiconidia calcicola]|uniref:Uncharacterized protein n=1 Tax=Vermiconidia calcicola TaxID=1690605 RepID=A0ACC3NA75_9PEZI|nr:hypothetical protein LTR37_009224 [Vermiconidia calcicola]
MSDATEATSSTALRNNRFSLSFPVQPSGSMSPVRLAQSPTREARPVEPDKLASPTGPMDTNFLTAIAGQERRVLELKEELARAEVDLNKLKRRWQQHEAQKKRNDAKKVTKLQPLQTSMPDKDKEEDVDGSSAWMQQEMERRKAMMSGNKSSNRTVFSGSRHTRTLSLLSPVSRTPGSMAPPQRPVHPPRKESLSESARRSQEVDRYKPNSGTISRAATTPDLTVEGTRTADSVDQLTDANVDQDVLVQTGKKVATGLRDGLWTFWEDLRQVAVGDEATQIPPPRRQSSTQTLRSAKKQPSKNSLRPSSRGSSTSKASTDARKSSPVRKHTKSSTMSLGSAPALADPSFWTDHSILPPSAAPAPTKKLVASSRHTKSPSKATSIGSTDNEAWDTWDESSPHASRSSSAASEPNTLASTVSRITSPRMSTDTSPSNLDSFTTPGPKDTIKPRKNNRSSEGSGKKDPIPWPALSNIGPKALRRTASHLMSEWEKTLTPSPSRTYEDRSDYMGLGAEAAAAAASGPADWKKGWHD